ncbi:DNA repair protein RecO [Legionella longbeachae]|uniref:DNA repair protein RecO n=1 Tax=Legionella longbeachae serogroup 1 (strain NSW150) TaxID=661367 RepID=D3HIV5_LEGLN|nr:DNA repair protein RecO [Legionella longbeachae]VEE02843.1 DNA repair protein RecO [Legionella oakridgensis]HBD7398018.1 DNA repair protein RecO [Legionella pneumophila]ARB90913.1 DNA repair protein RecO [Legionella longbeachae]ARM32655.1 DNA repair protein RecO [Legionella longbeachae]EEZ94567.1 DNA repair protein RecO [Legionella longbeachae D-4968]
MTRTVEAWVLHKQWSGDTSARVSFLTREFGIVQCLYKGGRTPKKQALLQAFTPLWVSIAERYDRYYIQSIESISSTLPLIGNALFAGLYINEILYYALAPNSSDSMLFEAYLFTLNKLVSTKDRLVLEALLRRFEWTLLRTCGYSFSLTQEARTENLILAELHYQFIAGEGFVSDSGGIPGEHILALAQDNLSDTAYLKSAKIIMRQAIDHLVGGREIKSRSLYFVEAK